MLTKQLIYTYRLKTQTYVDLKYPDKEQILLVMLHRVGIEPTKFGFAIRDTTDIPSLIFNVYSNSIPFNP